MFCPACFFPGCQPSELRSLGRRRYRVCELCRLKRQRAEIDERIAKLEWRRKEAQAQHKAARGHAMAAAGERP